MTLPLWEEKYGKTNCRWSMKIQRFQKLSPDPDVNDTFTVQPSNQHHFYPHTKIYGRVSAAIAKYPEKQMSLRKPGLILLYLPWAVLLSNHKSQNVPFSSLQPVLRTGSCEGRSPKAKALIDRIEWGGRLQIVSTPGTFSASY